MRKLFINIVSKIIVIFRIFKKNPKAKAKVESKKIPVGSTFLLQKETNPLDIANVDVVDDNISAKDNKELRQYTKNKVDLILYFGILWITWSYVLSTYALVKFGNMDNLQQLSIQVCLTVISTILGYYVKSLIETYAKKKNEQELILKQMELDATKTPTIQNQTTTEEEEIMG